MASLARTEPVVPGLSREPAAHDEIYRAIFDASNDAIFVHDIETGAVLDANRRASAFTGATLDALRANGLAYIAAVEPFTLERAREHLQRAAAGEPQRFEWRMRAAGTDRLRWVEVTLQRITIRGVDRLLALVRDIEERKAAEEALQASEESYRTIFQGAADGMYLHDPETGALLDANDAAIAQLGRSVEELKELGCMFAQDVGYTPERALPYFQRALAGESPRFEWGNRHKDGRFFWMETTLRRVTIRGRDRLLATARNIDDHKAAEEALRRAYEEMERRVAERTAELAEREAYYRSLIENTSDLVTFADAAGTVRYHSPSLQRMLGYPSDSHVGRNAFEIIHRDDVEATRAGFADLVAHPGTTGVLIYRLRHADGTWRTVESIARTVDPASAESGLVINTRDVTERRLAEAALARAKEEAERANAAKSEFLSRMSHELRTPMNSILGFGQLLARAELPPQHAKGVGHIVKAGRHLLHLINEVLEISRIEAGRESFSLEPVALGAVVHEALGLVRPLAQQHGVALLDAGVPNETSAGEVCVVADRRRLVQVLLNLLSNAIKYNRPGGSVRLACAPNAAGGWSVRVQDSGRGIPADRVDQLFTPFARLGAEQTDVEGTGLGLALSKRLCEAMGGALALEASGAFGSVFRIDLCAAPHPLERLEDTGTWAAMSAEGGEATLLYVEDNLANLSLVEAILLSRPGWRIIPALQGQLGVELAREHMPDVILLDLHLPDIPGAEVLRRLRADARTATIPVVVVSADATASSLERLRQAGADAYLTKPLDVDEFLTVVQRHLPSAAR
ncbi:PAS sensor protein [Gemmatirosa kalamazoonensis]|uniref:histidine kinase n=1 Tax=Gemmatirosa kalamazoonensis TaxID=861299 RepID=W0RFE1_9BACT|nr:PAS domain S-box protein [Gemmatirosa kalamazoonensis]AHG89799.1 PAS sensor protein [Gemmatirosa kalamazoonensis]